MPSSQEEELDLLRENQHLQEELQKLAAKVRDQEGPGFDPYFRRISTCELQKLAANMRVTITMA